MLLRRLIRVFRQCIGLKLRMESGNASWGARLPILLFSIVVLGHGLGRAENAPTISVVLAGDFEWGSGSRQSS